MRRNQLTTVLGVIALCLMAIGLTMAAYYNFIIPDYRNGTFYTAMITAFFAELIFFGTLAFLLIARRSPDQPDVAVRGRMTLLVGIWAIAMLIIGGIAVEPSKTGTFISDKLLLIQLSMTILVLGAVFFQYRQAVEVRARDMAPQQERRRIEAYAGGLEPLLAEVRALASRLPDQAIPLDGLAKRLDTLKTQLASASAAMPREEGRPANPADNELIEQRLTELHDQVGRLLSAQGEQLSEQLQQTRSAADRALAALRQREDALTF